MKMGNIVHRLGIEPTSLSVRASVLSVTPRRLSDVTTIPTPSWLCGLKRSVQTPTVRSTGTLARPALTRGQQLRLHDGDLDLLAADADQLVEGEKDDGAQEEVMEEGRLDEAAGAVQDHEDEEDGVHVVCEPEGPECIAARVLSGEDVHDDAQ